MFRILIIDDETDILEFVKYNLSRDGYEVYTACNGSEGLETAVEVRPHLILLDMMMPVMNGVETCRAIRSNDELKHTMVVFLSALSQEEAQLTGYEAGADDYIAKPRKEFALLELLISSPGRLFTREKIYSTVWGKDVVVGDRTIDVHIRKLRQKIGGEHIVTVKGVGYKFE